MKYLSLLVFVLLSACNRTSPSERSKDRTVQVHLHYGKYSDVNTFDSTLVKDLIPGTVKIPFSFTNQEQEMILAKAESLDFFSYPDTLRRKPNVFVYPDLGPETIRLKNGNREVTVVSFWSVDDYYLKYFDGFQQLEKIINDIVMAKPEYKALPPQKGVYL